VIECSLPSGDRAAPADFDAITVADLRARGSMKWLDYSIVAPGLPPGALPETAERPVIGAFVAEMDFGTAPAVTAALVAAVTNFQYGYLLEHLKLEFRRAFVEFAQRRYGWTVAPQQVQHIPDVLAGVEAVVRLFMLDDAPIILPTPAYMPFLPLFHDLGKRVIQVPMVRDADGRFRNDLAGIEAAFQAGAQWLMLVNPHNPTGRVLTRDELVELAVLVIKYDGRVLADEIHAPLVYRGYKHIPYASLSAETSAHTITAVSASKAWNLAGLKAAQLILTNADDLAVWRQRGGWVEHMVATLGVIASIAAYDFGELWLDEVLAYLADNRQFMVEYLAAQLPSLGFFPPEGTYLAWLDLRAYEPFTGTGNPRQDSGKSSGGAVDRESSARFLLDRAGLAVTDGRECGLAGQGFVRLNLATPRPILAQALERMAAALAGSRRSE